MILTPVQTQKIKETALLRYPKEMCGVCTIDDFIELDNVSDHPENSFRFDPVQYARVIEQTVYIVHSHTKELSYVETYDLRTPSHKDFINQKRSGKPWLIVGCEGFEVSEPVLFPRSPSPELLGRPFIWYVNDCYTLVMDYYKFNLGIDLDIHDESFDWAKHRTESNLFEPFIEKWGFKQSSVDDLQNGDLIIISRHGLFANHLLIYHEGEVIHQLGISVQQPLSMYYTRINKVLRYVG